MRHWAAFTQCHGGRIKIFSCISYRITTPTAFAVLYSKYLGMIQNNKAWNIIDIVESTITDVFCRD